MQEETRAKICLTLPKEAARNILIVAHKLRIPLEKAYELALVDPGLFEDLLSVSKERLSDTEVEEIEEKLEEICFKS